MKTWGTGDWFSELLYKADFHCKGRLLNTLHSLTQEYWCWQYSCWSLSELRMRISCWVSRGIMCWKYGLFLVILHFGSWTLCRKHEGTIWQRNINQTLMFPMSQRSASGRRMSCKMEQKRTCHLGKGKPKVKLQGWKSATGEQYQTSQKPLSLADDGFGSAWRAVWKTWVLIWRDKHV